MYRGLMRSLPVLGIQPITNRTANKPTENDARSDPRRATAYGRRQQPACCRPTKTSDRGFRSRHARGGITACQHHGEEHYQRE
jgi:hypothetical protein